LAAQAVLIVSEHSSRGYSGGRYLSWMMSEALAAGGAAVTVWTNEQPLLMRDFVNFPAHDRIALHVDTGFRHAPSGRFDAVFLVPSLRLDWSVFAAAVATANAQKAPLVFIDFEAPSWYNAENTQKRSLLRVLPWGWSGRYADVIISLTALGSQKAREYYRPVRGVSAFQYCHCSINSHAADEATAERQNQIICITRLDRATPHKGVAELMSLMCDELRGFRVVVIGSIPEDIKRQLEKAATEHGMSFVSKRGLTDLDKFREIKSSSLMVFLSRFEGYGYPPIEALYSGIPCIARPLPVLREVSGEHLSYLEDGVSLPTLVAQVLTTTKGQASAAARAHIFQTAKFESYVGKMSTLLSNLQITAKPRRWTVGARALVVVARFTGLFYRTILMAKQLLRRAPRA
jgi:glycosyltransferase involved in cell wall biosynthesis